jgi:putative transposase
MRRGQYSVEQIIGILKQHEGGRSAKELCRQYGFSDQTLKRWRTKYRGMQVGEAKRLHALEDENRRLQAHDRGAVAGEAVTPGDAASGCLSR